MDPSTTTHRTSRSGPPTGRAASSAVTPSRLNQTFSSETIFEAMKDLPRDPGLVSSMLGDSPPAVKRALTSADLSATAIHFSILARPVPSRANQGVTGGVKVLCIRSESADGDRHTAEVHRAAARSPRT